ncbi:MAG: Flp pilus assembly complex ATPase component TadA [Syntrophobacteraceae bacterium]|nr:Flp pilus assembly complex ATPase component TadA [Syntrophobacteraceae bacterium]
MNSPLPQEALEKDSAVSPGGLPAVESGNKLAEDSGEEIARLLLKEGHLTEEQFTYARRVQHKLSTKKTLTTVLQELEFITAQQLRETLIANRVSVRIGALLVELGYLTAEELQTAISIQKESKGAKKLGEVLTDAHFIEEHKLAEVLAYQLGFPLFDVSLSEIEKDLLAKVPVKWIADHRFFPVRREKGKILVAFVDPLSSADREAAEELLGKNLTPAMCSGSTVSEVLGYIERGIVDLKAGAPDEKTVVGLVNSILDAAIRAGASDVHIEPMRDRLRIRFRTDGVLVLHKDLPLEIAPTLTSRIKIMAKADIAERRRHQGGRILFDDRRSGASIDLRVSFYVTLWGEKTVLRLLNKKGQLLNLNDIGMVPKMLERFRYDALDVPSGVTIITGPTGSGKTTTLYACVSHLNEIYTSIITAEDPVEYVLDGISQCSIDNKIGLTYEETLRHIVRQDPDVIVVGEIRDRFSAETCIQAALTGHKVMTTFHTEDSIGGLIRLLNMDIEAFLISSTVVCVVAQRLLRQICPHCVEPYTPSPVELRRLGYTTNDTRGFQFKNGRGCSACSYTGYKGRVGVFELLVLNEMVKDALLARKTSYEIRKISTETSGLVTLLEDGILKAASGLTSLHEVLRHLPRVGKPRSPQDIKRLLGGT